MSGDGGFGVRRGAAFAGVVDAPTDVAGLFVGAPAAGAFLAGAFFAVAFVAVEGVAVDFVGAGVVAAEWFMVVGAAFVARALVAAGLGEVDDFRAGALAGAAVRFAAGAPFAGDFVGAARPVVADFFDGAGFGFFDAAISRFLPGVLSGALYRAVCATGAHDHRNPRTSGPDDGGAESTHPVHADDGLVIVRR